VSSSNPYASFSLTKTLLASFFLLHKSSLLCLEVSWIFLAMAHILTVVVSTSLVLVIAVSALVCFAVSALVRFAETEYIDVITNKIQDLESSLFEMLGTNPLSLHFVEFALRYGKRYGLSP
jgi:hypothetical protein